MSSKRTIKKLNTDILETDKLTNIVPEKGAIYVANGLYYEKLTPGNEDDVLTVDSTVTDKLLKWAPPNPVSVTKIYSYIFQLCVAYGGTSGASAPEYYHYSSITPATTASVHVVPETISFDSDIFIDAIGWKPGRNLGTPVIGWPQFTGNINFNFVYWTAGSTTTTGTGTIVPWVGGSPHFIVPDSYSSSAPGADDSYKAFYISFNPPITVQAGWKFCLRYDALGITNTGTSEIVNNGTPWIAPASMWISGSF
jgi:hypothetical protein